MGWGSATEIFDGAVDVALKFIPASHHYADAALRAVVEAMYTQIDWGDWDTQDESRHYNYLIDVMYDQGELDEDYYQWYRTGKPYG